MAETTSSLEVFTLGPSSSEPLVFLHDIDYVNSADYAFATALAEHWRVICPSHPGFGASALPSGFDTIDDLAYFYLDFLRDLGPAHVIGAGFGGWIAAEAAIRCTHEIRSLVLVDALGIKVSDRTTADIKDMFVVSPQELLELCWHDAELGGRQMALASPAYDETMLTQLLTSRQTAALVGWNPFMHNPKLRPRLRRIDRPTLVAWGASDGLVTPSYGRAYARAIPDARFEELGAAGHYPYLERPSEFVSVVDRFLSTVP